MFDELMASADGPIDEVFAKSFFYRRKSTGHSIPITATLDTHKIEAGTIDGTEFWDSWHGHRFDLASAQLVDAGVVFVPTSGDEIAEPMDGGGFTVYTLTKPPNGRVYDPIDAEERRMLVFTQQIRVEAPV
jgi:hypothetical protein